MKSINGTNQSSIYQPCLPLTNKLLTIKHLDDKKIIFSGAPGIGQTECKKITLKLKENKK